jgi:hypothetical protein
MAAGERSDGVSPPDKEPQDIPIWQREDPYLDENGELPADEMNHRARVDAAIETLKFAPVLIIPIGLVLVTVSTLLRVDLFKIVLLLPFLYALGLVTIPILARLRKEGDLRLPGYAPLAGAQKRNALIVSLLIAAPVVAYVTYGGLWQIEAIGWLRATLEGWLES